jgi:DNA-binding IclR family transcriptional regulator
MDKVNKSASRAIDILALLSTSKQPLTQLSISEALGIPKSSTFELIYTLMQKGVVEFDNELLKTFKLSMKMFELGCTVLQGADLYKISKPYLEKLSDDIKETIFLGSENDGDVVYLDRVEKGISSLTTAAGIGMRRPIHCTGLGKAILATYKDAQVSKIWDMCNRSESYTETTITNLEDLKRELKETRKRGFAIDNREREDEIFCVAVPIYGANGRAVAAISVAAIYLKMDQRRIMEYSNKLIHVGLEISHKMGFQKDFLYDAAW